MRREPDALAPVTLGLADPLAQGLGRAAELTGDRANRRPLGRTWGQAADRGPEAGRMENTAGVCVWLLLAGFLVAGNLVVLLDVERARRDR